MPYRQASGVRQTVSAALCVLLMLGMTSISPQALAGRFDLQSAEYTLYRGDTTLGKARVSLEAGEGEDCYIYSYTAKPSWLFRWATGSITERSDFCSENGQLYPRHYRYHRNGIGAEDENFSLSFDREKAEVTDHNGETREWPEGAVDRLLVQLEALRLVEDMAFPAPRRELTVSIVDDDRIKDYTLAIIGEERVRVPAGEFQAIRIERINDERKSTRFWVAPELGNTLVKVEQQRKDDPVIGIALSRMPKRPIAAPVRTDTDSTQDAASPPPPPAGDGKD